MKNVNLSGSGFDVLHNSGEWRIALHSFCEDVNGLSAFRQWGRHMDSEEAFVLLEGRAWLALSREGKEPEDCQICHLKKDELVLVEKGERHAILLGEGAAVLIIENLDMSNSVNEPMAEEVIRTVRSAWEKEA